MRWRAGAQSFAGCSSELEHSHRRHTLQRARYQFMAASLPAFPPPCTGVLAYCWGRPASMYRDVLVAHTQRHSRSAKHLPGPRPCECGHKIQQNAVVDGEASRNCEISEFSRLCDARPVLDVCASGRESIYLFPALCRSGSLHINSRQRQRRLRCSRRSPLSLSSHRSSLQLAYAAEDGEPARVSVCARRRAVYSEQGSCDTGALAFQHDRGQTLRSQSMATLSESHRVRVYDARHRYSCRYRRSSV